jgi:hypothetical protein
MTELDTVAFDIETIDFEIDDQLTVIGFDTNGGSRVFVIGNGRAPSSNLEAQVDEELATSAATPGSGALYSTYSTKRRNSGLGLLFLRTRLCYHGINRSFTGRPYIDAVDVFETRFNTSGDP